MVEKTITEKELTEWANKKYPDYANNTELMRMCWEKEQGVTYPLTQKGFIHRKVKEIKEGEFVELKVLIAKTHKMEYNGCCNCKKKIQTGQTVCSKCGGKDFMTYTWKYYSVGDNTGTLVVKALYPSNIEDFKCGKIYTIKGRVNKNDRNNKYELMISGDKNNVKPMLDTGLEKSCNAVLDYLDLFTLGVGEGKLREWVKEQGFKESFDDIIGNIKVCNKDGIITLMKED